MRTIIPGQRRDPKAPREIIAPASPEPRIDPPKATGGLSNEQKAKLSIAAKAVYDRHASLGLIDEGVSYDDWRRAECRTATGNRIGGFREARQRDYRLLRGHFANLNGDGATAINDAIHGSPEEADRGQAIAILASECKRRGHAYPEYPAAICRQQYKCPLGEASTKQVWSLIYTVRNR
jgi:hypothetical protein